MINTKQAITNLNKELGTVRDYLQIDLSYRKMEKNLTKLRDLAEHKLERILGSDTFTILLMEQGVAKQYQQFVQEAELTKGLRTEAEWNRAFNSLLNPSNGLATPVVRPRERLAWVALFNLIGQAERTIKAMLKVLEVAQY